MGACSACALDLESGKCAEKVEVMRHGQAERLMPMVQEVLCQAEMPFDELDAVVVTIGPGAFTGIRVGLSAAKALGVSLNIPVFGLTSFQSLAFRYVEEAEPDNDFIALIDSRRDDIFTQSFKSSGVPASSAEMIDPATLKAGKTFIGDYAVSEVLITQGFEYGSPLVNAQYLTKHPEFYRRDPEAVYMRPADVSVSKKKQRVLES